MPEHRPPFAPHVVGTYPERTFDRETGQWDEQRVDIRCEKCGATFRRTCASGNVRTHVVKFAIQHLHRDPMAP